MRTYPAIGHCELRLMAEPLLVKVMVVDPGGALHRNANSSTMDMHLDPPGLYTVRVACASASAVLRVMVLR